MVIAIRTAWSTKKTRSPPVTAASASGPSVPTALALTIPTLECSRLVATAGRIGTGGGNGADDGICGGSASNDGSDTSAAAGEVAATALSSSFSDWTAGWAKDGGAPSMAAPASSPGLSS